MPSKIYSSIVQATIIPTWEGVQSKIFNPFEASQSKEDYVTMLSADSEEYSAEQSVATAVSIRNLSFSQRSLEHLKNIRRFMQLFDAEPVSDRVWYEFSPSLPKAGYELSQAVALLSIKLEDSSHRVNEIVHEETYVRDHQLPELLKKVKRSLDGCKTTKAAAHTSAAILHGKKDSELAASATTLDEAHSGLGASIAELDEYLDEKEKKEETKLPTWLDVRIKLIAACQDVQDINDAIDDVNTGVQNFISACRKSLKANKDYIAGKVPIETSEINVLLGNLSNVVDIRAEQLVVKDTMWTRIFYVTCIMLLLSMIGLGTYYSLEMHMPVVYVATGLSTGLLALVGITCNYLYQQSRIFRTPVKSENLNSSSYEAIPRGDGALFTMDIGGVQPTATTEL